MSKMLQIKGMPSHASLIHQIFIKNIHNVVGNPWVAALFKLVEFEVQLGGLPQQVLPRRRRRWSLRSVGLWVRREGHLGPST